MQQLNASRAALAADFGGDAVWQSFWAGTTLQSILISTIAAMLICSWLLKSPLGFLAGAIIGSVGNFMYLHWYLNKGDASWQQLGGSDGLVFFICIAVVSVLDLIFKKGWQGMVVGLGLAVFVDVLFVHWIMVWWNSMGSFDIGF